MNQMNQLPLSHRRALQPKKLQRRHLHPLLLDFHRGLHARETHGRVPSHDRAHLVCPEQNRRRRSAPTLRRTLTATLVAVPPDVTYFAPLIASQPLSRLLFSWRTPELTAPPLRPSCRAMSTRIQRFSERLLPCFSCASSSQPERPPLLYASSSPHSE